MSIITVSRGSYCKGKEIAESLAEQLGYECISREVILEASEQFDIPDIKLVRAIHDAPTILDRLTIKRSVYIACIRVALLRHLVRDDVVYHGLAGHFLVNSIPHALKVRVIADMEDRVCLEMSRNDLSHEQAARLLAADDEQRRRWSMSLHGVDPNDTSLYDLVINVHRLTIEDAVDIISRTVGLERFKSSPTSQRAMIDTLLAAEVQAETMSIIPNVEVTSNTGVITIRPESGVSPPSQAKLDILESRALAVPGVESVCFDLSEPSPSSYSNPWYKI